MEELQASIFTIVSSDHKKNKEWAHQAVTFSSNGIQFLRSLIPLAIEIETRLVFLNSRGTLDVNYS
jgi:hypothetical protein